MTVNFQYQIVINVLIKQHVIHVKKVMSFTTINVKNVLYSNITMIISVINVQLIVMNAKEKMIK